MHATGLRRRAHDESGLTLVETMIVLTIVGVLLAVAVPSYLGFTGRADAATARANLRAALPAVEAFYSDFETYDSSSMTVDALYAYDRGLSSDVSVVSGSARTYCIKSMHGDASVFKAGPGAAITTMACG